MMVIQVACVDAVQRHSRGAPTVAVPVPPFGPKAAVGADTVVWHRGTTLGLVALDTLELPHPTPATVANAHHATAASARGAMRRPVAQSSPMLRLSQHPRHAKRPSAASVCRHDVPIIMRALEERHGQARRCAVYGRRVGRDLCGTGAQHVLKTARQERTQPVLRSQRRPTSDKSLPSSRDPRPTCRPAELGGLDFAPAARARCEDWWRSGCLHSACGERTYLGQRCSVILLCRCGSSVWTRSGQSRYGCHSLTRQPDRLIHRR